MTNLKTMTLPELVKLWDSIDWALANGRQPIERELARRQRMLDAAEALANAVRRVDAELFEPPGGATHHNASAMRRALSAYTAAKETP